MTRSLAPWAGQVRAGRKAGRNRATATAVPTVSTAVPRAPMLAPWTNACAAAACTACAAPVACPDRSCLVTWVAALIEPRAPARLQQPIRGTSPGARDLGAARARSHLYARYRRRPRAGHCPRPGAHARHLRPARQPSPALRTAQRPSVSRPVQSAAITPPSISRSVPLMRLDSGPGRTLEVFSRRAPGRSPGQDEDVSAETSHAIARDVSAETRADDGFAARPNRPSTRRWWTGGRRSRGRSSR
jgi:hypothetical protein